MKKRRKNNPEQLETVKGYSKNEQLRANGDADNWYPTPFFGYRLRLPQKRHS